MMNWKLSIGEGNKFDDRVDEMIPEGRVIK